MTAWPGRGQPYKPRGGEAPTVDAVRLRRVKRRQVRGLSEGLADPHVDSRATSPREPYRPLGREDSLNRLTVEIRRPGFTMVIAETDCPVGCAFGFPVRGDGFWWPGFDGALPRGIEQLAESGEDFAITDLLVRPCSQDRDVARRLRERLLDGHPASIGVTLVDRADRPSRAALRSWGWLDVGESRRPVSATLLRVPVLPVGQRTAVRLEGLAHDAWTRGPG
ncbi:hypothetical protein [Streptomyces turgidiscabies]|uniref:N-acetyltransferase domain-containing protein n=1 Tax=Streptomyces turgidiscabies TaxID=85558 RepID=A0ABU0RP38_9ACTN|nr:hypothetical protein [Streptomyces turgidiscabies]MDQ0933756.1 hypothetical protein [Streptomyces turgidiscabies]